MNQFCYLYSDVKCIFEILLFINRGKVIEMERGKENLPVCVKWEFGQARFPVYFFNTTPTL